LTLQTRGELCAFNRTFKLETWPRTFLIDMSVKKLGCTSLPKIVSVSQQKIISNIKMKGKQTLFY